MDKKLKAMPTGSLLMLILFIAVLASAVVVIYTSHKNRQLLNELYQNMSVYNKAQVEWGRLVLEQSTWTAYSRVEKIAVDHLSMHIPTPNDVRIIGQ